MRRIWLSVIVFCVLLIASASHATIFGKIQGIVHDQQPVSYTHLDVYKRQDETRAKCLD